MVTIKDISNKLGISISSVSKALNGATDISKETRERVLEAANELGYIKKFVVNNKNLRLGVIVDEDPSEYSKILNYDVINGFNNASREDGNLTCIITLKDTGKKGCLDLSLRFNNVSGCILLLNKSSDSIRKSILKIGSPIVMVNNYISVDKPNVGYVGIDIIEGMKKSIAHLVNKGHKNILFISQGSDNYLYQDKLVGYIAALTSFSINYNPENVLNLKDEDPSDILIEHVKRINPTAICCDDDLTAYKVINILKGNNYNVPRDISVIGFDNNFISTSSLPSISTIGYDKNELGVKAYIALKNILNGNNISRMQIKTSLIERDSTMNIN